MEIKEGFYFIQFEASAQALIQNASAKIESLLGYPLETLIDQSFWSFVHPEDKNSLAEMLKNQAAKGVLSFQHSPYRLLSLSKKELWVSGTYVQFVDEASGEKFYQVCLVEISQQVANQVAIGIDSTEYDEKASRYQILFDKSADALLILENNYFVECNQATIDMLGYQSKEEFLNTHPSELSPKFQPDGMDSYEKSLIMNRLAIENGSHRFEWDHVRANGEIFPVEVLLTSIPPSKNIEEAMHVVWRDITARKQAEAERANQMAQLKTLNHELEQFSFIASHDLQEPLRTLISFCELLAETEGNTLSAESKLYIKYISESSLRMRDLVRGLMEYSRIGKERSIEKLDCNKILKEVLDDLHWAIQEKKAVVQVGKLPEIMGFPIEIRALFQNLIGNAVKFSDPSRPIVVTVSGEVGRDGWMFAVADNGIGIEEIHQTKIFEIFKRLHRKNHYEGTGIGLAHCKKIVELHGGNIWVDSTPNVGSSFNFVIPFNF